MTYSAQTWVDNDAAGHPLSAARMGVIETGIVNAHYKPSVAVYNSAAQAIVNNTTTTLSFDTERWDTDPTGMHSAGQPTRIVFQQAGIYLVLADIAFPANATGLRLVQAILNGGATVLGNVTHTNAGAGGGTQMNLAFLYQATASDYCQIQVQQVSGGSLSIPAGTATNRGLCDVSAALLSF